MPLNRTPAILVLVVTAALLAMMNPAQAIYIETPLDLRGSHHRADVGQEVEFVIQPKPDNDHAATDWADKTLEVRYSYDENERNDTDPDGATSNQGARDEHLKQVQLDDRAGATFHWTIPETVDGYNLYIHIQDADGQLVAFTYLAVGDAPEQMRITSGDMGDPEPAIDTREHGEDETEDANEDDTQEAPAPALVGLLACLGLAGLIHNARRD